MIQPGRVFFGIFLSAVIVSAYAQSPSPWPNPYDTVDGWGELSDGRTWGSSSAVYPASDGSGNIWVAERCGQNSCVGQDHLDPIMLFAADGELIRSFGKGLLVWPHGIFADGENNVWIADARGDSGRGHQVHKFSEDGELLMSIGEAGVSGHSQTQFRGPSDVLVAPDGHIFVADGHGRGPFANSGDRVMKFSPEGEFVTAWGKTGAEIGEFQDPHALAMNSDGLLLVGDRHNRRIQVFDQEGNYQWHWNQFGRPSGIFIDDEGNIYVADSESNDINNPGFSRGMWIADSNGWITGFIPDPEFRPDVRGTTAAEGVAVDSDGNIYGAEVGPMGIKKYVQK